MSSFHLSVSTGGVGPAQLYLVNGIKVGRSGTTPGGVVVRFGAGTFSPAQVDVDVPGEAIAPLIAALTAAAES